MSYELSKMTKTTIRLLDEVGSGIELVYTADETCVLQILKKNEVESSVYIERAKLEQLLKEMSEDV